MLRFGRHAVPHYRERPMFLYAQRATRDDVVGTLVVATRVVGTRVVRGGGTAFATGKRATEIFAAAGRGLIRDDLATEPPIAKVAEQPRGRGTEGRGRTAGGAGRGLRPTAALPADRP
ncbi:Hypothetical protein NTJ_01444 [Nesidiocoris tenuis]|uniref:Uncharacterized protein n=1 Tax=Nesidiocoris tenuis TaxID=355587 RepID=A0ABN7A9H6_9HEMI|nr:Hypothetical protein NTJ_01444 [Nesidiocoris tenuis]